MRQRHQGGDVGTKERLAMPWLETQRPAEEGLAPGRLRPPLPRAGVVRGARLAALLLVASAAAAPAATPAAEAPPGLQLDDRATARSYEVLLRIDPAESGFSGRVALDLEVTRPLDLLWLHARQIEVESAVLDAAGREHRATVVPGNEETLGFAFAETVPPGPARLVVDYRAVLAENATVGAFRQQDGGHWYVFTQFESIFARRAIPCIDQPAVKVPWRLAIEAPAGNRVFANTPLEREVAAERPGWRRFELAPSEPLPSYLVAFAVGPFETVDAGRVGDTPLRIVALAGKASQAAWAAEVTAPLLRIQEEYFGIPYPYAKLDSIAIPQTVAFGAMENVGLITYREPLLLAPPEEETPAFRRDYAAVGAHELAHMWFGNLVTPRWWDDIWLNESFATWMSMKTLRAWPPAAAWYPQVDAIRRRGLAIHADRLVTAQPIRRAIRDEADIERAFDGISYSKGATLLGAFETWAGEELFRRGIQRYLRRHAHGTATSTDFLAALEAATEPSLAAAFASFLEQPGVPLVELELECAADGGDAVLELRQRRFLPVGSSGDPARRWQVPVCARWQGGGGEGRACTLLRGAEGELPLAGSRGCPSWVLANEGGLGYYLPLYPPELLAGLPLGEEGPLTLRERLGVVRDSGQLALDGVVPLDAVLPLLAAVADSPSHHLVAAVVEILAKLDPHLVPAGRRAAYEAFVRQLFGERARALGLLPRPGESDEERFLRKEVVVLVADHGGDERLRAEGRRLAERWLEDREAVPPEAADLALVAAALSGDAALYDRYLAALRAEPDRRHRTRLLSGLFSFREPALVRRSWGLLLDPEIDPREVVRALRDSARGPDSPPAGLELLEGHVERLAARLPEQWAMDLPRLIGELCGREHLPRLEALRPRLAPIRGAGDELDAALEQLRLCLARRAAQLPAAECFFGLVTTLGISSTRTSSRGRAISRRRSSGPARSTTPAPPTRSVPANSRSMAASSGSAPSGGGRLARPADSDFEADRAVL